MGLLQQLGRRLAQVGEPQRTPVRARSRTDDWATSMDEGAVERYRYLLRTASPEHLEQVHAEAFARLTPEQRRMVLADLREGAAPGERVPDADDTAGMARFATRAEVRRPGTMERVLGGRGAGLAGGLLAGFAAAVVGSALVDGLVDTGFGDGGLLDLGHDDWFAGGFGDVGGFGGFDL